MYQTAFVRELRNPHEELEKDEFKFSRVPDAIANTAGVDFSTVVVTTSRKKCFDLVLQKRDLDKTCGHTSAHSRTRRKL